MAITERENNPTRPRSIVGRTLIALAILAAFVLSSYPTEANAALITSVAPFTGDLLEDFESFPPTALDYFVTAPNGFDVFGGAATHNRLSGGTSVYWWTSHWGFGGNGSAKSADGNKGFGINSTAVGEFLFVDPISDFGAYFGTAYPGDTMFVRFFDELNAQIGADQKFSYTRPRDGILEWHGWNIDMPIKRVEWGSVTGSAPALDSIRVNLASPAVPEPSTYAMAAIGLLGLSLFAWRKRMVNMPFKTSPALLGAAVLGCSMYPAAPADATVLTFSDEPSYLAAVAAYDTIAEDFESSDWNMTGIGVPSNTSQGLTWSASDGLKTGSGWARSGIRGVFDSFGNPDQVFVQTADYTLFGVGGWIKQTSAQSVAFHLDGAPSLTGNLTDEHAFFGVVDTDGFTEVGLLASNGHWGGDDFTFAYGPAVPEPSTYAMAGLGLLGLGLFAWRKRRAAA